MESPGLKLFDSKIWWCCFIELKVNGSTQQVTVVVVVSPKFLIHFPVNTANIGH